MEQLYAVGVSCILFIQYWFAESVRYFELVNTLSNPHHVIETLFPVMCTIDSVFAAQLLLCLSVGGWLNSIMKWWLLEDRPYWWVRETSFYPNNRRPQLRQFHQTCETGPGCPSGHTATTAMLLMLAIMWISHVMNDRKVHIWWWKYLIFPLFAVILGSVVLARMFVASHFPHQCLLGALVVIISNYYQFLINISQDLSCGFAKHVRNLWRYVAVQTFSMSRHYYNINNILRSSYCLCLTEHALFTATSLILRKAFRWCESPEDIHVSTTPVYALVESTAHIFGWAMSVTPAVAEYRHYTKNRSVILAIFTSAIIASAFKLFQDNICKANALWFYAVQFLLGACKCMLLLRVVPAVAVWPYPRPIKDKTE
ncbi:hypothetical protein K1T71_014209 [Dendrolimus kikuchii]|uniref:Uncharacterized protein n=1 Tax=Dendrolimus kikuchii TaxID=765133 RepID=A0ACC1CFE4_9NEOP|nr:hypothetical protein K1T71_014209 [Dendrolimus kikuchii]